MPYVIPETMPQDWLVPALESVNIPVTDDRAEHIEFMMKQTYRKLLDKNGLATLNARLRAACLASAHLHKDD